MRGKAYLLTLTVLLVVLGGFLVRLLYRLYTAPSCDPVLTCICSSNEVVDAWLRTSGPNGFVCPGDKQQ